MRDRAQPIFDLGPLHRPLWWAALALLLVNDNLLKGGAVVPGWLTGKLSDFAFLIVAPVLLAAILPRHLPRRRAIALASVALVYTAADLSLSVSDAIVSAAHVAGLPWRLWPDATDLLALAVLPLTWWLMRPAAASVPAQAAPARARPLLESVGVFAGAFACLATSAPPVFGHAPFLVNQTAQPRPITATWLLRTVPCDANLADLAATLNPSDLDDPHSTTLASGDVAVLDMPPPPGQPLGGRCPSESPWYSRYSAGCAGVLIQASPELALLAVFPQGWNDSDSSFFACTGHDPKSKCKPHFSLKEDPGPDALSLREHDGKLVINVGIGSEVQLIEVSPAAIAARAPSAQGCRPLLAEEQQIASATASCTVDADCRIAAALPVPGRACVVYGNRNFTDPIASNLRMRWEQQSCLVNPNYMYGCPPPQPAACHGGRCQEACPGVALPVCPYRCASDTHTGSTCYGDATCEGPEGTWCTCMKGAFSCAPPTKAPGCSITCVQPMDRSAPPARDASAGADVGTGPDAGGEAGGGS